MRPAVKPNAISDQLGSASLRLHAQRFFRGKSNWLNQSSHEFVVLDGLRGVAAISVMLFHYHQAYPFMLCNAYLAVDLFFLLSGFVIAHAYERRLLDRLSVGSFLRIRLIRLWPLLVLGSVLGLVPFLVRVGLERAPNAAALVLPNFFFLPAFVHVEANGYLFPINVPAWSLFFEIMANLAYALLIRFLNVRLLAGCVIGFGIAATVMARQQGNLGGGENLATITDGFVRVGFSFFGGVLLYRLRPSKFQLVEYMRVLWSLVLLTSIVVAFQFRPPEEWRWLYDLTFVLIVSPAAVAVGSALVVDGGLGATYALLGFVSYAVYVLHVPLASYVTAAGRTLGVVSTVADPMLFVLKTVIVFPAVCLAAYFFDAPARKWISVRFAPLSATRRLER